MKNKFINCIVLLVFHFAWGSAQGQDVVNLKEILHQGNTDTVSFLFLGDIMQHQLQIESAYDFISDEYRFADNFKYLKPIFQKKDVVVGNLEVTFGGEPYSGYPQFSCPKYLAGDIKDAGITHLGMANNHCCDKGAKGFDATLAVLDSLGLPHTGTFLNRQDKKLRHPLIIEKKGLRFALFNYTYGLNGNQVSKPRIVNVINKDSIKRDLQKVDTSTIDGIIVFMHWGVEYQHVENKEQQELANVCFENGATIVIGAHPHVIQPMKNYEYVLKNGTKKNVLVAYSLGNYVSNYGTRRYSDGGTLVEFSVTRGTDRKLKIIEPKYRLVWVYRKPKENNKFNYYVLPAAQHETDAKIPASNLNYMKIFLNDSRDLYNKYNVNVPEVRD